MRGVRRCEAAALLVLMLVGACGCAWGGAQSQQEEKVLTDRVRSESEAPIRVGAVRTEVYVPRLLSKRVGLVCNHTSLVQGRRLVDTLLARGVNVVRLFTPEHGLRGAADAGAAVSHGRDEATGISIVSLYGQSRKPSARQLEGLHVVLFDMQDVGVRCYTYASTMHYVMEACAEQHVAVMILDRPNPNGYFIDGPVLQEKYKSFVGMHPVPWVHGMTLGELALMINGEGWLKGGVRCDLEVIPCENYTHARHYDVPVAPSPNLPTQKSILLYPTLAFLEGTTLSVGRGTNWPFEVAGSPDFVEGEFVFTPTSRPGAKNPPHEGRECRGISLATLPDSVIYAEEGIFLFVLQRLYAMRSRGKKFFIPFFDKLAGTPKLRQQLEQNMSADSIRKGWKKEIEYFKERRKPYLLYE